MADGLFSVSMVPTPHLTIWIRTRSPALSFDISHIPNSHSDSLSYSNAPSSRPLSQDRAFHSPTCPDRPSFLSESSWAVFPCLISAWWKTFFLFLFDLFSSFLISGSVLVHVIDLDYMHIVNCELLILCISVLSVRIVALVYMCHGSLNGRFVDLKITIFIMSFIKALVEYGIYKGLRYDTEARYTFSVALPRPLPM